MYYANQRSQKNIKNMRVQNNTMRVKHRKERAGYIFGESTSSMYTQTSYVATGAINIK